MEKGFMGDPTDFFFFRVTTGGGVRRVGFWEDRKTDKCHCDCNINKKSNILFLHKHFVIHKCIFSTTVNTLNTKSVKCLITNVSVHEPYL